MLSLLRDSYWEHGTLERPSVRSTDGVLEMAPNDPGLFSPNCVLGGASADQLDILWRPKLLGDVESLIRASRSWARSSSLPSRQAGSLDSRGSHGTIYLWMKHSAAPGQWCWLWLVMRKSESMPGACVYFYENKLLLFSGQRGPSVPTCHREAQSLRNHVPPRAQHWLLVLGV